MPKIMIYVVISFVIVSLACGGSTGTSVSVKPTATTNTLSSETTSQNDTIVHTGKAVFEKNCTPCHSLDAEQNLVGPTLAGIATRSMETLMDSAYQGQADTVEAYLRESLLAPNVYTASGFASNVMPAYQETLSATEIEAVTAYLLTLE